MEGGARLEYDPDRYDDEHSHEALKMLARVRERRSGYDVPAVILALLRGMDRLDRLEAWQEVEREDFGGRDEVLDLLATREDQLTGDEESESLADAVDDSAVPEGYDDQQDFDEQVQEALAVARPMCDSVEDVQDKLEREVNDQCRKHVIAALNELRQEFENSDTESKDSESSGPHPGNSSTHGGEANV